MCNTRLDKRIAESELQIEVYGIFSKLSAAEQTE